MRIATGAARPRNDIAFTRGTVWNRWADRGVAPTDSLVAGTVVRRDDVGIVPYGGFTRSAYMRAVGDAGPYGSVSCGVQGAFFV